MPRKTVGFLGFDGVRLLDLTGPLDAFTAARVGETKERAYETVLLGLTSKTFVAASGVTLEARHTIRTAPILDTIVIPGGPGLRNPETARGIAEWLVSLADRVRRIAAVSTGVYPLAQSGLLDRRRVTTHWRYVQNLANTFRQLEVDASGSFIQDGRFCTCGGGTAGIEMSLALIQEDDGPKTALRVARELLVNLKPASASDRQVIPLPEQPSAEDRLAELPAFITSRLRTRLSLKVLAERAGLCPRHFSRVFQRVFQRTPTEFVEYLRMTEAARRLAAQPRSIGEVAELVGYKSPLAFRRAFARHFGVTPRRFQKNSKPKDAPDPAPNEPLRSRRMRVGQVPSRINLPAARHAFQVRVELPAIR